MWFGRVITGSLWYGLMTYEWWWCCISCVEGMIAQQIHGNLTVFSSNLKTETWRSLDMTFVYLTVESSHRYEGNFSIRSTKLYLRFINCQKKNSSSFHLTIIGNAIWFLSSENGETKLTLNTRSKTASVDEIISFYIYEILLSSNVNKNNKFSNNYLN